MAGTAGRAPARRPGGRTARVRAQVLAATVELVARDGIAGLRYEEVAERAGVNKTSVYRNWPDREELVVEALLRYIDDLVSIGDTGDLRRDLVDFLVAIADSLAKPTVRAVEQATQAARDSPVVRRAVARVFEERGAAVRRRVALAVERGELPPGDHSLLGAMVTGPVHFVVNRGLRPFSRADAERIVDVVLAGIRATAPQRW
ncbi:MAG TPA: TetR/AcrR family transcriptional regulator C-terminal ligand-binding domain-containing protein [Pseudonocardia sp.]|uniref:TetR/AcrR family transcriptional regulator n=1 Tax=Pseudonocardia sp. TaxID=60912 RepID=UPI002B4B5D4F|nr:TetR/AcrR family transcriptional regulator C-terminal ligand-binding domain-containing protein [Pseudonocardia sp.]HLU55691.1 TetR/AcrR family transcriptional regulator C-terminal ligand-binding domain-containing protein [Pseudonocardia sp.]